MNLKNKNTILITGGSGFIGSSFSKFFKNRYDIYTLDKKKKNQFLKDNYIQHVKCDLCNYEKLEKKIRDIRPSIIIHLAAQSTIDFIETKEKDYLRDNIFATENIVKLSIKYNIKKFIFSSTAAVYKANKNKLSEADKIFPNNIYGKTKKINENFIIKYLSNSKVKFCILRFFNVCSSLDKTIGEFHNPETHLIPKVIHALNKNKKIYIYGNNFKTSDGTCLRDYVHIKDIVIGINKSISYLNKKKFGIFNLGSGQAISVKEIVMYASNIIKKKPKILIKNNRKGDNDKLVCKILKAKRKLRWFPKYSNIKSIVKDEISWQTYLERKKLLRSFYNK